MFEIKILLFLDFFRDLPNNVEILYQKLNKLEDSSELKSVLKI